MSNTSVYIEDRSKLCKKRHIVYMYLVIVIVCVLCSGSLALAVWSSS